VTLPYSNRNQQLLAILRGFVFAPHFDWFKYAPSASMSTHRTRARSPGRRATKTKPRHSKDSKRPFSIELALRCIRAAVKPLPKAALFELAADGFNSPFEQLVACIISIRTRDETTVPTARRLFAVARTAVDIARLRVEKLDQLIGTCTFHAPKARQIHELATRVVKEFGGELPCDEDVLLSFRGVGPKCANLVLGIACGKPRVGVDIHVHRVTNRWGYVDAPTPEKTLAILHEKLPRKYWIELNSLLVPFGKHICTGHLPICSTCPVLDMCQQAGVASYR
jgi:endonuclease-3